MKNTKITLLNIIFFLGLFFVFVPNAHAEIIRDFNSQIKINSDSSILVTETIKYDFGSLEKHGIFRDIPIRYKTSSGNKSINLELQNITIDGQKENYEISKNGSSESIKIGKAESVITGEHTYVISYIVKGSINYFENLDELYWNVTGNGWPVVIENTSVSIEMPSLDKKEVDISCYEGILGSNEKCMTEIKDNLFTVKATRSLQPSEGLSFAIDFPKGIVHQPTKIENILNLVKDNLISLLPIIVFLIMFFVWNKYGKDPKSYLTIIAQYEPPKGMKPTLVGSLVDGKPDFRDITAGLIYLAEQGFIKIKRLEKEGILGRVDYEIELTKDPTREVEDTELSILKLYFENNLVVGSIKKISDFKQDISFASSARKIINNLYQEMTNKGFYVKNPNKSKGLYILISIAFVFLGMSFFANATGSIGIFSIIISGVIITIFGLLMGKKTKLGAETKDHILGFKLFLSITEKDRLNFHDAPEKSPEQFMEFLPYAIALGVENKWAKQFENVYINQPSWYQGNMTGAFIASSFVSNMSDFSNSVNTSLSYTSKNAANGGFGGAGGGFSGGGFGGGGGGSW